GERDNSGAPRMRLLHEQVAQPAGGRGYDHDIIRGESRVFDDSDSGPSGADHRDGYRSRYRRRDFVKAVRGCQRELRVASARLAQVRPGLASQPRGVDARTYLFDDAGNLAARSHRQRGQRKRPAAVATSDNRVEHVYACGVYRDTDLSGTRPR